jgi:cystinosin
MSLLLYNADVRQLYHEQHNFYPLLTNIDLIYSVHGFILTMVSTSQLFFWGFKKRSIVLRRVTKLIILSVFIICLFLYSIVGTNRLHQFTNNREPSKIYTILDLAITLSYVKILMSLIKYIPQLSHNYKRKSVTGFSIFTVFLDLSGGILSLSQLFLDSYITTGTLSYDVLINNGGKLGLSFVTFFFDICFIYQWYIYEHSIRHDAEKALPLSNSAYY